MKVMYHATDADNLISIIDNGIKANNIEGIVYLAETSEDAIKFLAVRGVKRIVTFKVKIKKKDMDKIIETFDHSYAFFKCRSFGYIGDISPDMIEPYMKYEI